MRAGVVAASFLVSIAQTGLAQTDTDIIVLEPNQRTFVEKYDQTVDVAGQLRAGLMFGSVNNKVELDKLIVEFDEASTQPGDKACVRVASRNGVFSATWEVTLNAGENKQAVLGFPTEYRDVIEAFSINELVAIASQVGADQDCTVAGRRYLMTSWGEPDRESIMAYLNADSTEALIAAKMPDGVKKQTCEILPSSETSTAFDTICTLSIASATGDTLPLPDELVILRKNFSTVMKKIRYPL